MRTPHEMSGPYQMEGQMPQPEPRMPMTSSRTMPLIGVKFFLANRKYSRRTSASGTSYGRTESSVEATE